VHPQHAFKQVTFDVQIPESLPQVFIDVGQIHQVLLNLFINAADVFAEYTDSIGVIKVMAESIDEDRNLKITIIDNGPGITGEILPKIFEPHITSKKDGHGFGLWTCQRIIRNHGGSVTAYNSSESGAVFEIVLPIARNADE
jgi:two-component system sensor histidine kinase AtoS